MEDGASRKGISLFEEERDMSERVGELGAVSRFCMIVNIII